LQEVLELRHDPGDVAHPTLEFMETPVQSKYYNVGVENMRYTKYVRGEHAKEKISGATWVLGGSTTFGHGVSDDETIPYYLNELDTGSVYINFAGEAYHQSLEIDKLLLLLKKGYTAKRVVFVDGLNDIVVMKESNFPPAETPMRFYDAYGYVTNMERLKTPEYELILGRLPIFDWLQSELETRKFKDVSVSEANGYDDIYSSGSLYHENPILHYKLTLAASQDYGDALRNISWYEDKILSYYRLNDGFLQAIARAFGFQYYVFFQPQANLSPRNPFHRDSVHYAEDPRYRYCQLMVEKVREAIREGSLPNFYDISDVDADCQDCYVDFTHYNPRLCKLIAESIIMRIHERDAHRK
jgi:hypothetical protein